MEDFEEIELSFAEKMRIRRIEKRHQRMEQGGPGIGHFIAMRTAEYLVTELIISLLVSAMIASGIIPSTMLYGIVTMCAGWLVYMIYAGVTCHHIFWAVCNVKTYLTVNLAAYGITMLVSFVVRLLCDIKVFSWMFLPTKFMTLIGWSSWISLAVSHVLVLLIIFAILINVKFDHLHELQQEEEEY